VALTGAEGTTSFLPKLVGLRRALERALLNRRLTAAEAHTLGLSKALVRVVLPLPPNVKLADDPLATTVAVWRVVPTVVNAGLTAPYQADGRLGTLEDQALSAMHAHSEITPRASAWASRAASVSERAYCSL